jgi:hypothetical protein
MALSRMICPQIWRLLDFLDSRTGLAKRVQLKGMSDYDAVFTVDGNLLKCDIIVLQEYLHALPPKPYSDEIIRAIQMSEI